MRAVPLSDSWARALPLNPFPLARLLAPPLPNPLAFYLLAAPPLSERLEQAGTAWNRLSKRGTASSLPFTGLINVSTQKWNKNGTHKKYCDKKIMWLFQSVRGDQAVELTKIVKQKENCYLLDPKSFLRRWTLHRSLQYKQRYKQQQQQQALLIRGGRWRKTNYNKDS